MWSSLFQNTATNLIFFYGTISAKIDKIYKSTYNNNVYFRELINCYSVIHNSMVAIFFPCKHELNILPWVNSYQLIYFDNTGKFMLDEYEYTRSSSSDRSNDLFALFEKVYERYQYVKNNHIGDYILMMKLSSAYHVRVIRDPFYQPIPPIMPGADLIPSTIRFITVEYTHPKMAQSIFLDIPKTFYIDGNEILSSAFIMRCLEYQSSYYIFDLDYVVKVVDNNICIFELTSNEYVRLSIDKYHIV
jgi:hypothetical protein